MTRRFLSGLTVMLAERSSDEGDSLSRPEIVPLPGSLPDRRHSAALALAQEVLRGLEHFVISTPDLDTPGFLRRLRGVGSRLLPGVPATEVEQHRQWASEALPAFGQLQRRYLSEREDELWRLLGLYQEHLKGQGTANDQFLAALRGIHERLGAAVRLDDLRQVRERLDAELTQASGFIEKKLAADADRARSLVNQIQELEAALVQAREDALRDPLTGVYHRGGFQEQLEAMLGGTVSSTLAIVDIDNFKSVNDSLGHLVGDDLLKLTVQLLRRVTRPGEVVGRYGGDEFFLLAPRVPPERVAERFHHASFRQTVTFQHPEKPDQEERLCSVRLSVSVGLAGSLPGDSVESLISRADAALYEAKQAGKAQTRIAQEPAPV
jgi:diguanylate cyclase (GGDEF)-like protein